MAGASLMWISKDLLHCPEWKLSRHWWWGMHKNLLVVFPILHFLPCILTINSNRPMALFLQRSAEVDSRSNIPHQLIILSSAMMYHLLLTSLLARNTRWPALRKWPTRLKAPPSRLWPSRRHQMLTCQQMPSLLHREVTNNYLSSFLIMIYVLLTTSPIGTQDTAADPLKDIDEEDTLEITSQTSPISQVFYLFVRSCSQLYWCRLICIFPLTRFNISPPNELGQFPHQLR